MSRGASEATLVESNIKALVAIASNLKKTRLQATVCREDVFRFLDRTSAQYDLIFADPPYAKSLGAVDYAGMLCRSEALVRVLAPNGLFILERSPGSAQSADTRFRLVRQKRYGASEVLILTHAEAASL